MKKEVIFRILTLFLLANTAPAQAALLVHQFYDTVRLDQGAGSSPEQTAFSIPLFDPALGGLDGITIELKTAFTSETFMRVTSATTDVVFEYQARNVVDASFAGITNPPEDMVAEDNRPLQSVTKPLAADVTADFTDEGGAIASITVDPATLSDYLGMGSWDATLTMSDDSLYNARKPSGGIYLFTLTRDMITNVTLTVSYAYTPVVVPLPGAVWLFGSGLLLLPGRGPHRRA